MEEKPYEILEINYFTFYNFTLNDANLDILRT